MKSHEFYKALIRLVCARDGGPGSGYFNHAGRPGKVGGGRMKTEEELRREKHTKATGKR